MVADRPLRGIRRSRRVGDRQVAARQVGDRQVAARQAVVHRGAVLPEVGRRARREADPRMAVHSAVVVAVCRSRVRAP
jgi:hypothetical protein